MKRTILFVTQTLGDKAACGIGLMGDVTGKVLLQHPEFNFKMVYADTLNVVEDAILAHNPEAIIYNYAPGTTPWMDHPHLRHTFLNIKHIRIMHDMSQSIADAYWPRFNHGWEYIIADDPSVKETPYVFTTNRLLPGKPTVSYAVKVDEMKDGYLVRSEYFYGMIGANSLFATGDTFEEAEAKLLALITE